MTMTTVPVNEARTNPARAAEPATDGGPTGATSLLPDPEASLLSSGDVGAELAALAVLTGRNERSAAREERQAAEARAVAEEAGEVQAIRAEASNLRAAAWVDAVTTLGAQAAGPGSSGGAVMKAGKALADGYFSAGQKDDEANAKACEAAAGDAKAAADDAHDALADASDYIKSALAFYQEYVTTRAQTLTIAAQKA